jgi:hypothetical protein
VGKPVAAVWADLLRRPDIYLVARWNWKSAMTSALIRGGIYFFSNLSSGFASATSAMLVEFSYRTLLSGAYGSVTQALRDGEPEWAATWSATAVLPLTGHLIEFTIHYLRGTPHLRRSLIASVTFSVLSILFNSYAMRRGVLITGREGESLGRDFLQMPRMIAGFIAAGPQALWRRIHRP